MNLTECETEMAADNDSKFRLDILGPRPQDVPASDLAEFIKHFEAAIRAEFEAGTLGEPLNPTDEVQLRVSDSASVSTYVSEATSSIASVTRIISLVGISEGSDRLHFAVAPQAVPALARISRSIARREFKSLARTSWEALHEMSQITKRRAWGLRLPGDSNLSIEEAVVPEGSEIPPPDQLPSIVGTTVIRARVMRTGGAKPRAELRVPNRASLLYVDVTESDAKFLGQRLYERVALEGVATWDPTTWAIREFIVTRVLNYHPGRAGEGFRALAEVSGGTWDQVDALDFVRKIREDGA